MKKISGVFMGALVLAVAIVLAVSGPAQAASYTGNYFQDFNSLGTTGTGLPSDWSFWTYTSGGSPAQTWNTSIPASGVQAMGLSGNQAAAGALVESGISSSTTKDADQWYNIARDSTSTNRVISTSPTTVTGQAFQLLLTNNTGVTQNNIVLSYDLIKFYNGLASPTSTKETVIGYQLFYALGSTGSTWTNVSALNPTSAQIPQPATDGTLGYSSYSVTNYVLPLTWTNGQNLYLRWVDDNADILSPDQIIGIDNVRVVPIPAAAWLLGSGLLGLVAIRRRMKK